MIVAENPPDLSAEDEADLVAYVDGRIEPERRARVEARAASDPAYAAALARQREGQTAIAHTAETTGAPLVLRSRVEAMGAGRERRHGARGPSARTRLGGIRWPAAGAVAAGVAAVLAAVMLAGGGPGVGDVAAAAVRPPTAAVATVPPGSKLLSEHYDGVAFPNYAAKFGWRPTGTRTDEIGGRDTRTVFYEKGGRRIGYTVVGGDALSWPDGADKASREGTPLRALTAGGRDVVTWRRRGHTCVLSAKGVPRSELLDLAGWKGKGEVPF
jgi:anti-sigma factor RsiW